MLSISEKLSILVVEDNSTDFFLLEQMLLSSRLKIGQVFSASRISEAREILKSESIHLVLLDLSLPDSFGIGSLREIRDIAQRIPVIVLTGLSDEEVALETLKENAQDYLVKGEFNSNLLSKSIEYSIERKKVEEKILASEDKYRQMFYKNPLPMWINDVETHQILEVNDAAIVKYGYSRQEFLGLFLCDIQKEKLPSSNLIEDSQQNLWKHRKSNGETIIVEFTYYPISYFGKTAMQAQVNDITENIRLENELTLKKQQLVEAVLQAQETERKNIGRELHDNINQILTAVKLSMSMALEDKLLADHLIKKCIVNTGTAIEEIRKLSRELILPGNLKELGLVHSIEDLLKETLELPGVAYDFQCADANENFVSEEQKLAVYRIVQEQLNNILKHSNAGTVVLRLLTEPEEIQLTITDDGKGFDPGKKRNGIGLTNIISRAELFGGKVKIVSAPGRGCSMEIVMRSKKTIVQHLNPIEIPIMVN